MVKAVSDRELIIMDKPVIGRVHAGTMLEERSHEKTAIPFDLEALLGGEKILPTTQQEVTANAYKVRLESKVQEQTKQIRTLSLGAVEALVTALEMKDAYTAGHSRRVTQFALTVAQRLGMPSTYMDDLRSGALLHDVGKIAIDPSIQNKPGKLTAEEYEQLMTHVPLGVRIVKPIANENVMNIIRFHHARYDTDPLRQALDGETIPIGARIVTVADSFDAMTSDRPYRKGLPLETALCEIEHCAGTQFDPLVTDIFLTIPATEVAAIARGEILQ